MRIEYYHKTGSPGCCVDEFYVIIFNRQHQALKPNMSSVYEFDTYTSAGQADHAITLAEHAERTRFYYIDIDAADITLAANSLGIPYTMEIWKAAVGGSPVRNNDELVEVREFMWDSEEYIDSQLSQTQVDSISGTTAQLALVYDSQEEKIRGMAFLERAGVFDDGVTTCNFRLISRADAEVINVDITDQLTEQPGMFHWENASITLLPDEVYAGVAIITDADGNTYESAAVQLTWD